MSQLSLHPMLTFWEFDSFGGVGTSGVDREYEDSQQCPVCRRRWQPKSPVNVKVHIAGRGGKWPDILACNIPLLHERVVETISNEGLTGFVAHPTTIVEVQIKQLAKLSVPDYYLIQVTGGVDIDPNELDEFGGSICPGCFTRWCEGDSPYKWEPKRVVPKLETWDNSDFVTTRNLHRNMVFCTRAFVDLACKHRWTNFVFGRSMPGVTMWGAKPPVGALSYFDPDWFEKTAHRVRAKHPDLFQDSS